MRAQSAPSHFEEQLSAFTMRTHGILDNEELRGLGLSRQAVQRRLASGRLRALHRGVYAVGPIVTTEGRWLAAVRACGPNAVLSHRSAAALWQIRSHRSRQIEVSVATRNGRKARKGITVHRPTRLTAADTTTHDRIPVTTPARTLLDLAAVLPRRPLERAVDEAYRLRLVDDQALVRTLEANQRRRGAASLQALLQSHLVGSTPTRNDLEEMLLKLCDDHGMPRPIVNAEVGPYSPDFLWPECALIVETDGRESHGTRAAFEHDRARDAWLTANGYRVVRFTHRQVFNEPGKVASLVARLLRPDR